MAGFTSSYGKRMLRVSIQRPTAEKVPRRGISSDQYWCQSGLDQDSFTKRFINKYIGYVIFATKNFSRGDFLLEYVGEFLSLKEAEKREHKYKSRRCYMYYYRHKEKTYCVDATKPSDRLCRLVNDANPKTCNAVMKLKMFSNEKYPRLCLYALKNISIGEEITYDYGDEKNMEWRKKEKPVEVIEEESDEDPFDLEKDFKHKAESAASEPSTEKGIIKENEEEMEEVKNQKESDNVDTLLLEPLSQKQNKPFEISSADILVTEEVLLSTPFFCEDNVLEEHRTELEVSEPIPTTQTEQRENGVKRAENRNPVTQN